MAHRIVKMSDEKINFDWMSTRNFAYLYADNNFSIFPVHTLIDGHCSCGKINCERPAKHPATSWSTAATIDKRKIDTWWNKNSEYVYNIGIATGKASGITVVDIDAGSGGLETWAQICAENDIPDTFTVQTGGGGYHLYFKYTNGIKTGTNLLGTGIDIRNDGGYIIAPPSLHKSGKRYAIDGDVPVNIPLAEWPDCLTKIYNLKPNLKPNAKNETKKGDLTLKKAEKLLEYIEADDYQTWLNVGVILGREFDRSDEAWALYNSWADKYDGKIDGLRNKKMQEAFYQTSQQQGNGRGQLTGATLYRLAYANGYLSSTKKIPINYLCYVAEENAFVYLINGGKWTATAVEGMCAPVKEDNEVIKPTTWLINNRSATCVTNSSVLPSGYINGFDVNNGTPYPIETSSIVNLFNKSLVKPLPLLIKKVEVPIIKVPITSITDPFKQFNKPKPPAGAKGTSIKLDKDSYNTDKKVVVNIDKMDDIDNLPWINDKEE